jgi:hypothetical protein
VSRQSCYPVDSTHTESVTPSTAYVGSHMKLPMKYHTLSFGIVLLLCLGWVRLGGGLLCGSRWG